MPVPSPLPPDKPENDTSLPGLRSWRAVYIFVGCVLAIWVALLTWLTLHYA